MPSLNGNLWESIDTDDEGQQYLTVEPYLGLPVRLIHCDPLVLHAPGNCSFCDELGKHEQATRATSGIAYTDSPDNHGLIPCPARAQRGDKCQVWCGNQPGGYHWS